MGYTRGPIWIPVMGTYTCRQHAKFAQRQHDTTQAAATSFYSSSTSPCSAIICAGTWFLQGTLRAELRVPVAQTGGTTVGAYCLPPHNRGAHFPHLYNIKLPLSAILRAVPIAIAEGPDGGFVWPDEISEAL